MSGADIRKWDDKYRGSAAPLPVAEDELIQYLPVLPPAGMALDLACGLGRNSLFLAQQGWQVTALDGSAQALAALRQSAQSLNLAHRITTQQADLDNFLLPGSSYDLIVVVRYLNLALAAHIEGALRSGGHLFYKTFNRRVLSQRPGFNPAYTIETEDLISAFPGLNPLARKRGDASSEYAFMLARKP